MENKKDYISWDEYFMGLAILSSFRSKDPSRKVGACIVDPKTNTVLSLGYNGFPRGCDDNLFPWGKGNKTDFEKLLFDKLPDSLTLKQKNNKLRNLLSALRIQGVIQTDSKNHQTSYWILTQSKDD